MMQPQLLHWVRYCQVWSHLGLSVMFKQLIQKLEVEINHISSICITLHWVKVKLDIDC